MKMTPSQKFKSIVVDSMSTNNIHFQNPFTEDPYTNNHSRKDICRSWAKENKIRTAELDIWNNDFNNRA